MAITFDKAFGIHPDAMIARSKRAEMIAGNIANADTPGYKAKDMDFKQMLSQAKSQQSSGLNRTHEKHFSLSPSTLNNGAGFRVPDQPDTGDGNTVDIQRERNMFLENALQYRASTEFLNGKITGLKKALSGGQ